MNKLIQLTKKTNSIEKMSYLKRFCIATSISLSLCISEKQLALANAVPDNSLGSNPSTVFPNQTVNGVDSELVGGGTRRGANLFHSFNEYSVAPGKGSYFLDPTGIKHIFVRVTGNGKSQIDGTIGVLGGNANLFLLNPNGINFSENSRLDLDGSFTAATADRLLFHGYEFSAYTPREVPTLAIEVPIGLKFTGGNGDITVNNKGFTIYAPSAGSTPPTALENPPLGLSVKPGNNLSLFGANINFNGGVINTISANATLGSVKKGVIDISNSTSEMEYVFERIEEYGDINFLNKSIILQSIIDGFGSIKIFGNNIYLTEGSNISLTNYGPIDAKDILIKAENNFIISGDVETEIPQSFYRVVSGLTSTTFGGGRGAKVSIFARNLEVINSGLLLGATYSNQVTGIGSYLNINADTITIADPSNSATGYSTISLFSSDKARAGNIDISTKKISLYGGGRISTAALGDADAGNINIVSEYVYGTGYNLLNFGPSSIGSITIGKGNSGEINISSKVINLLDGANLGTSTFGEGNAENVKINADYISVGGGTLPIRNGKSFIFSSGIILDPLTANILFGGYNLNLSGNSGKLEINANIINLYDGGSFSVSNDAGGGVGNLTVNTNRIILNNAAVAAISNSGMNGTVSINSNELVLINSSISTSSNSSSNGGNIDINTGVFASDRSSSVLAQAVQGKGGNININAEGIIGSPYVSASSKLGVDGTVQIRGDELKRQNNFKILIKPSIPNFSPKCVPGSEGGQLIGVTRDYINDEVLDNLATRPEQLKFVDDTDGGKIKPLIRERGYVKRDDGKLEFIYVIPADAVISSRQNLSVCTLLEQSLKNN